MRFLTIISLVIALGLMAGCKKDEAGTSGNMDTTATGTTAEGAVPAPGTKEETSTTEPAATGGVVGTYDSTMDDATKAAMEKAGQPFGGGTMTFNADGSFDAVAMVGKNEIKTKGTYTVEGTAMKTTVSEVNGEKVENSPAQMYTVGADGKEIKADGTGVTLVKQ